MTAIVLAISLMGWTPSPSPVVSRQLMIGESRSEENGTYHFRATGPFLWHAADMAEQGQWKLRNGDQLELIMTKHREIVVIDRVVHETLYVQTKYQKEVWFKQPGL